MQGLFGPSRGNQKTDLTMWSVFLSALQDDHGFLIAVWAVLPQNADCTKLVRSFVSWWADYFNIIKGAGTLCFTR